MYKRLCKTLVDKGTLISVDEDIYNHIDYDNDWYVSLYQYTEEQYETFLLTKTVKGITEVTTNRLVWDFDSKDNIELARQDAYKLCTRLIDKGISDSNICISFSGNKGFGVEVRTTWPYTVEEFRGTTFTLAEGLETFDKVVNNASRVIRVLGSIHKTSNLYKIPLTLTQLASLSIDDIKQLATSVDNITEHFDWQTVEFPYIEFKSEPIKNRDVVEISTELNFSHKPKHLTNCRWALQNGFFKEGTRSNALICLAATYKNLGYDMEIAYRMLKGVAEIQSKRNECDRFPDEELYNNIVAQVYSPFWKNGQFSCREPNTWLHDYCQSLGHNKCKIDHDEDVIKTFNTNDVFTLFKNYSTKLEENILYTGIESLDKKCKFLVGTSNAIVAPPSLGKTTLLTQILNHNSNKDISCLMFSYDMFHSALYLRMVQRHTGLYQDDIYDIVNNNEEEAERIKEIINREYRNVHFSFRTGQSLDELDRTILSVEERTGKKLKLVGVDYNELITTEFNDPTASSSAVAQGLRRIANEREVCIIQLVQPSKMFTTPADEIVNFNAIKGSSAIAQSLTVLLGCSRPGFNPMTPETDKFMNITCLKNRNGPLFSLDFSWDGLTGRIDDLDHHQKEALVQIRELKEIEKEERKKW